MKGLSSKVHTVVCSLEAIGWNSPEQSKTDTQFILESVKILCAAVDIWPVVSYQTSEDTESKSRDEVDDEQ